MTLVIAAAVTAFAASIGQSVTGFGFALLMMPVLTVVAGPQVAVATMTAIGVPLVVFNAWRWRHAVERRIAARLILTALVGVPLGVLVLRAADERVLTAIVGVLVLVFTAAIWRGIQVPAGRRTLASAGVLSGALATSVGTNGPPLVVALHAEGLEPAAFRATLQTVFALEGSIALLTFWQGGLLTADIGWASVLGIPAAVGGALLGDRLAARVDRERFRTLVLMTLALSGVLAVVSAGTR
ncbi:MAG: sulfite exporter TauE/SafE family protein [Actinomycetota bacterium]